MKVATLRELRDALIAYCEQYPDIVDNAVNVHSECGYAGADIVYPITLYKGKANRTVSIYTDDDWDIDDDDNLVVYKLT